MQWRNRTGSSNIIDRRGIGKGIAIGGGGLGTIILLLAVLLCGGDPRALLDQVMNNPSQTESQSPQAPGGQQNDEQKQFVSVVLADTEEAWNKILPQQAGMQYREPKLVLFDGQVSSACGYASAAVGPFYCPGDQRLYLDFSFFRELRSQFNAPGDFAQAYVIAHEVGHHVQNLLGTMDKVNRAGNSNELSVRLELQADCYAGVWANYAQQKGILEVGDIDEAMQAAAAVGDDSIQQRQQGYVRPDSFTHGTSQQRKEWFMRGFQSGNMQQCDTFGR